MAIVVDNEIDLIMSASIDVVVAACPSLHGYKHVVPQVTLPAVMAFPPDEFNYGDSFGGADASDATLLYCLRLYVQRTQDGSDQQQLNTYLSRSGTESVIAALEANPRLNGACADVQVMQAANYGNWPVGSQTYLGVELRIRALML